MWTEAAAITKRLSDADAERAATARVGHRSFLGDLDIEARERLDEIRGQIDRGEVAHRRDPRDGRPATDDERRRVPRRQQPPRVRTHTKADRILGALHERPEASYGELAASLGVSQSYLKQIASAEGFSRPKGPPAKPKPVEPSTYPQPR